MEYRNVEKNIDILSQSEENSDTLYLKLKLN